VAPSRLQHARGRTGRDGGALCPKGQSGLQSAYDPYRIVSVLKRKPGTKRGEGEWITIPFDQAIEEVVEGGNLFGEGHVEGFRDLYALRDAAVGKEMADFVKKILDEKDPAQKQAWSRSSRRPLPTTWTS
jgi:tetrathionate reductase subunit A